MNTPNLSLSDLAASIADGKAIDWEELKSSTTTPQDLALLSEMETIARISEMKWSTLRDQPTRKLTLDRDAGPTFHQAGKPNAATPPQRWGHLEILERIGGGGFGEVYRARDSRLEREVALKLLRRKGGEAFELDSSVLKEGRLLARLRHPNVATIYGVDQYEGQVGLWMEFVRGKTLEALLQEQGPLGAREAVGIGLDLCRALAAVHGAGLIHGDIKAQNVIREEGGRIVLADFGLGRDLERNPSEPLQGGTPPCMAPELLRGGQVTVRSDIYALGVLLFRLLTGTFPVRGRSIEEALHNMELGEIKPLRDLRPDLPEGLTRVIERALLRDPMRRFATPGEFERALTSSLGPESAFWHFPWIREPLPTWLHYSILLTLGIGVLSVLLVIRVIPPFWDTAPKQRESVFVADFENRTDVTALDLLARDALILTLEQSHHLDIFPRNRALQTLDLMRMSRTTRFEPWVARQLCRRENVATLISGTIVPVGQGYEIQVRASDPTTDAAKTVLKLPLLRKEDLYTTIDNLGGELRRSLGESRAQVAQSKPLEHVTTRSLEALERFSKGREHYMQGQTQEALIMFRSAVDLDPEFAVVCEYLGLVYDVRGQKDEALRWVNQAYNLRHRATERERYLIEALYHNLRLEYEKAVESYKAVTLLYPRDADTHRQWAIYQAFSGRTDDAVRTARTALDLDPGSPINQATLVLLLAQANRYDEALQELRTVRPDEIYNPFLTMAEGLAWLGKGDIIRARKAFDLLAEDANRQVIGRLYLAQTAILQGELVSALEELEKVRRQESEIKDEYRLYLCRSWLARLYQHFGRRKEALRVLESLGNYQASPSKLMPLRFAALSLSEMGKVREAESVIVKLETLARDYPSSQTQGVAAQARGELERQLGNLPAAQEHLEQAHARWPDVLTRWSLARLWDEQGNPSRALPFYREIISLRGTILRYECGDLWVLSQLKAAQCELKLGNHIPAARFYDEFLRAWKSAIDLDLVKLALRERQNLPVAYATSN